MFASVRSAGYDIYEPSITRGRDVAFRVSFARGHMSK